MILCTCGRRQLLREFNQSPEFRWTLQAHSELHGIILPFSNSIRSSAKGVSLLCCGWDVFSEFRSAFVGVESLQPQEADRSLPFPSA